MATKKGCRKAGRAAPKKRGGTCGPKLKSSRKRKGSSDCRDASGSFVPVPQCLGRRRKRR